MKRTEQYLVIFIDFEQSGDIVYALLHVDRHDRIGDSSNRFNCAVFGFVSQCHLQND